MRALRHRRLDRCIGRAFVEHRSVSNNAEYVWFHCEIRFELGQRDGTGQRALLAGWKHVQSASGNL